MKTIFVKNPEYDARVIWAMLKSSDPAGVLNRAKTMKIDSELIGQIAAAEQYDDIGSEIEKVVRERHLAERQLIDGAIITYQSSWDKINDFFYAEVERITSVPWEFSEYQVVVSPFHRGISNRGKNVVARDAYEDPEVQKRKTAHEITMIQMWYIFDNNYPEAKSGAGGGSPFWALNEITTVFILGLEPTLNQLWTANTQGIDRYLKNYPQLLKLRDKLKPIYQNKKDFKDYLSQAVAKI